LADTLVNALRSGGVSLHLDTPVRNLDQGEGGGPRISTPSGTFEFDRVVSTAPLADLSRITKGGSLEDRVHPFADAIDYQGVVNVLVLLRRSLTPHYWIPVVECGVPFDGIVETTRVIDLEDAGGYHLVYLVNYVHRSSGLYNRDPAVIATEYVDALLRLFPDLSRADICQAFVFKAPFVEPLYTPGYGRRKPPQELVPGRVYLATTSQVYPNVTSWNSSTGLAKAVVGLMQERAVEDN
jgi:protoporphyrinogen oxidase